MPGESQLYAFYLMCFVIKVKLSFPQDYLYLYLESKVVLSIIELENSDLVGLYLNINIMICYMYVRNPEASGFNQKYIMVITL